MALNIGEKKDVVKEVSEIASSAQSAVAAEYRGLTVHELTALRKMQGFRGLCKSYKK